MKKTAPFLLLLGGILLAWLAITGRLAAFIAAVFTPDRLVPAGSGNTPAPPTIPYVSGGTSGTASNGAPLSAGGSYIGRGR